MCFYLLWTLLLAHSLRKSDMCVINITGATATVAEQPVIDALAAYNVTLQQATYLVAENLDALNAAVLVIIGRSANSGEVIPSFDVLAQVTTLLFYMSPFVARGDRAGLVATGSANNNVTGTEANI